MLILKYTDWTAEQGFHATRELLSLKRSPTAIIVTGDTCALGVFDEIDNEGLKVPEDIAVVSFDDMVFAPFLKVPLTTIRQPMKQLGNTAVELLFKKLASKFSASRKIILDTELIIRESCGFKKSQEENFKVK